MSSEAKRLPRDATRKELPVAIVSRDEMNLAEFPLTVLSTRVNPKIKTLEFKDSIVNKSGREINREWIITGTDKFGLPTSSDDEVLLGLLKLTVDQQFTSKKVEFTRYELLRILRWSTEGKNYSRLQKALDRLSGVRIKATNAFFDNESKTHCTKNFGILDAYEINDGRDNKHKPSFFIWSDEIFQSFQSGFIKKLDLDFYLDLKSSVSKRLYRYLDKNFWYKSRIKINLYTLAHEKIGISRNYKYASSLKQQLEPAISELTEMGFISQVEYQGRGKGTEILIYAASAVPRVSQAKAQAEEGPNNAQAKTADFEKALSARLGNELISRGLKAHQVRKLLETRSDFQLKKVQQIILYYDHLVSKKSHLVCKSPVGFLYRAVENAEEFSLPKNFQVAEKKPSKGVKQDKTEDLAKEYEQYFEEEVSKCRQKVEPDVLAKIQSEVEGSLVKVKSLITEDRFRDTVEHGVGQKLAKLFALPSFQEWQQENK